MEKSNLVTKEYLDKRLKEYAQVVVEAVGGVLDQRLVKTEENLKREINNVQTLIDGYVKTQEEFKQEFVIMKEEVKQIKDVLKEKFDIEIGALR